MNFKEKLIEFILKYDKGYSKHNLLSYPIHTLVIIKVQLELELEQLKTRKTQSV